MAVAAHHVAFGVAVASLAGAALRTTSLVAPDGMERALAAVALAAAAAVLEALGLGLVGLGGSPVALTAAAVVTWLAARLWLPTPSLALAAELGTAWRRHGAGARAGVLAALGLGVGWTVWLLGHPVLGIDALVYHLPEMVSWVQSGHPGRVVVLSHEVPVGYYPQTNEVLGTWGSGIARSFVPAALMSPAALALLVAAGWHGLRARRVPAETCALAIAALACAPLMVAALAGPNTDLPGLAWLAVAAALCGDVGRRPGLLAPALVAAGLAVGTKTTTALLVVVLLAWAFVQARAHLRAMWRALGLAAGVAAVVGLTWYVRNLLVHGWPLWPFQATSFSDPLPAAIKRLDFSFLQRPRATLRGREGDYAAALAGYVVVLVAAAAAPLLARRRAVLVAAAIAGVAVLAWMAAPFTGIADDPRADLSLDTVRYLMPAVAAAAVAVALAARASPRVRAVCDVALLAALVWNLARDTELPSPLAPELAYLVVGAAVGALVALALGRVPAGRGRRLPLGVPAGAVAGIAAAGLAFAANGYVERHGRLRGFDTGAVAFLAAKPAFRDGRQTVAADVVPLGILAGDRLQHPVRLLSADTPCPRARALARRGWVTIDRLLYRALYVPTTVPACFAGVPPLYADAVFVIEGR
jgi:hypothetical protein